MVKINYKGWAKAGGVFGILAWIIAWIFQKVMPEGGLATISFAAVDVDAASRIKAGVDTSLGAKIMSALQGVPIIGQSGIYNFLVIIVSAIAIFWVGRTLYNYLPKGKTPVTKLLLVATYGSLVVGIILGLLAKTATAIPIWFGTVLATLIAFGIVALVYVGINRKISAKIAPIPE